MRAGTSVVDILGGLFGAFGTVLTLQQRKHTGKGGLVESALFESVVFLMGQHLAITAMNGAPPPPMPERVSSWAIYEIFNTNDGQQVFIGITSDGQWKRFCEFFGQRELAADPKLATNNQRIEARPWLVPKVAEIFKRYGKDELEQKCLEADISFAPVARPQDLFDHPHLLANGSLAPTTLPGGVKTRLPLLPFQMLGWRPPLTSDPPEVGQHNDAVLAGIGYDAAAHRRAQGGGPAGTEVGGDMKIRRVVTSHDDKGKALVAIDEVSRDVVSFRPGATVANIWSTAGFPVDNNGLRDTAKEITATTRAGGTVFRVIEFAPGVAPRNHRTDSIDYAIVLSGEIDMTLDDQVVTLRAGDVLVQRGTIHNWINRSAAPCVIAFVLIDAKPVEHDGKPLAAHG